MRVWVVVVLLLACARAALADDAATFDATLTTAAGFDHVRHDGKVQVHGGGALACDQCHALDAKGRLKGKPGHAQCFGACHGAAPPKKRPKVAYVVPAAQGNVCAACHAPSALAALIAPSSKTKALKAAYPPFRVDPDFGLALSHAKHDAAGAACATCHDAAGKPAGGRGHDRCSRCHLAPKTSTTPAMTACTQCHAAAWGPARSPELIAGPLGLGPSFSHAGHAKVARAATCASCHGAVTATTGHDIPAPRTEDCRACHDGKTAFATTGACTRCHQAAPTGTIELVRPTARFSHDRHRSRLGGAGCATCHTLDRRGEATPPRHASCAALGCHREDFATTTPLICGACHVAIEPWRPLRADALPVAETEFGARMAHRTHADRGLTCAGCHTRADARRERRPPRGHAACSGEGGCHTAGTRSARPPLTDCDACHRAGSAAARVDDRLAARWSVRARFRHDAHPGDCETCHTGVWSSAATIPVPAKKDCAACHDGKAAFKMTGHGCRRCHGS
jgi:c(7)-type cytochrome triheme protein